MLAVGIKESLKYPILQKTEIKEALVICHQYLRNPSENQDPIGLNAAQRT